MNKRPLESLPLTRAKEIDAICGRFEAEFHAGKQPRIEAFLLGSASWKLTPRRNSEYNDRRQAGWGRFGDHGTAELMICQTLKHGLLGSLEISVAERLSYVGESLRDSLNPKIRP